LDERYLRPQCFIAILDRWKRSSLQFLLKISTQFASHRHEDLIDYLSRTIIEVLMAPDETVAKIGDVTLLLKTAKERQFDAQRQFLIFGPREIGPSELSSC
jgi:hypothetical protein